MHNPNLILVQGQTDIHWLNQAPDFLLLGLKHPQKSTQVVQKMPIVHLKKSTFNLCSNLYIHTQF